MLNNPVDDPIARRVAIHELGHGATYFLIYHQAESVAVYSTDGIWEGQQPPPLDPPLGGQPSSEKEWLDVIAWTCGGWAAVHLAIRLKLLPPANEAQPGDNGYLGPMPADEGCAIEFARRSGAADPAALVEKGRQQALDRLGPHMMALWDLVPDLISRGYVDGSEIEQACR